jgi:hypothetical protein
LIWRPQAEPIHSLGRDPSFAGEAAHVGPEHRAGMIKGKEDSGSEEGESKYSSFGTSTSGTFVVMALKWPTCLLMEERFL